MNYKLLLTTLFLSYSLLTVCQENLIGINYMISNSTIEPNENYGDISNRNGNGFGINYSHLFKNKLSLGVQLNYEEKGVQSKIYFVDSVGNLNGKSYTSEYFFEYLSIPIMIGYSFGDQYSITPNVGLRASYLLNAETKFPSTFNSANATDVNTDLTDDLSSLDFGAFFEIDVRYFILDNIAVEVGYKIDRSLSEFDENDIFSSEDSKHHYSAFTFGFKYLIKE